MRNDVGRGIRLSNRKDLTRRTGVRAGDPANGDASASHRANPLGHNGFSGGHRHDLLGELAPFPQGISILTAQVLRRSNISAATEWFQPSSRTGADDIGSAPEET